MAGIYSPSPALRHGEGTLILRAINKRFHAFVSCQAALFPVENRQARAALAEANLVETPAEFRDAVAYLSNTAVLNPFEGGAEVTLYLARPGKEADFQEIAPDLQEGDLQRLFSIPDPETPLLVVFGDAGQVAALAAAPPEPKQEPIPEPEPIDATAQAPPQAQVGDLAAQAVSNAEPAPEAEVLEIAPKPVAKPEEGPPAHPASEVEPAERVTPKLEHEPEAEPTLPKVEAASSEAEAQPAVEAPTAAGLQAPPPDHPPVALAPQPEPVEIEPPAAPAPAPIDRPTVAPPPAIVHPAAALQLGDAHYALRTANVEGSTVVVWQARRLTGAPSANEFEVLQPSAELRQRLIAEARSGARFGDEGVGELVAVKIALPGREADLERSLEALRRLGNRALRLYYPGASPGDGLWPAGFPCLVVEWAGGTKLSESPLFSEAVGLEVCFQIADLLDMARQAAPEIVLTDSLKADNVVFAYDDRARLHVRIVDWNVYASEEEQVRGTTLVRFGEIMSRVFAPDMPFAVNWAAGNVPLHRLAAGQPGDPGAMEWDGLTYGTQTLIRRALQGDFGGDAGEILRGLRQSIKDQQARWAEEDPLWQARLESGPARLNWLDMAAAKQGRLSAEARARLDQDRLSEIRDIVLGHTSAGRHLEAVIDLRTALRRHPRESFFRWAMLAHTIGMAGPDLTFRRLHLDEALTHLQAGRYSLAQNALERGAALFDDLGFEPEPAVEARRCMEGLLLNAEALALAESAVHRLAEDWRVEDAESRLALAEDLAGRSESLARSLLAGRDAIAQQKLADLRSAIAAFHEQHRGYDPTAQKREAAEQARQLTFTRLLDRARAMASREQPDAWGAAQQLYERAADEYPDLWQADADGERSALAEKMARRKLADARRALAESNWGAASVALAHATLSPATRDAALGLQAALAAFQRGEVDLRHGDPAAALASFTFAAVNSAELRAQAEAKAAEARNAGGAAETARAATQVAPAPRLDGLADELRRQLTEVSLALNGMMEEALTQAQENSTAQSTFLKQAQDEQWARQQTALRALQEEQAARLQTVLGQLPAEQIRQQQTLLRKLHEDQLAELKATLIRLYDEQSGWQQQTLKQIQAEQSEQRTQYQADFKKAQEDQNNRLQAAVQKLQEDFLSRQQAALTHLQDELTDRLMAREKREEQQPKPLPPPAGGSGEEVDELKSELQKQAANQASLADRTSRLMTVNVVLALLLLLAICLGAASFGWPLITRARPSAVANAGASPTGPSPLRSTTEANNLPEAATEPARPTEPPPTPEPVEPTAPTAGGLQCSAGETFSGYYDCVVTNPGRDADTLSLYVQAAGGQANGFSPSVMIDDEGSFLPDGVTSLVPLGDFRPDETRSVRVVLSCLAATGCPSTTFILSLWTDRGTQQAPGSELRLTAEFPTANQ